MVRRDRPIFSSVIGAAARAWATTRCVVVFVALIVCPLCARAQEQTPPTAPPTPACSVAFSGRVTDGATGRPIAGAAVCLPDLQCVQTDVSGFYAGLCYQGQSAAGARPCASAHGYAQNCQGPWTPSGQTELVNFPLTRVSSTPTPTPTSCGVSTPVVNAVTSPTDLLQQTITGSARVTGARYLQISSEAGTFHFNCDTTPRACGASFAVPIALRPGLNHLTVCDVDVNTCGGTDFIACTTMDRNGNPLVIDVQVAPTPMPTATITLTPSPLPTPTEPCSGLPCSGTCALCPSCTPGTICPESACRLGTCQMVSGACTCVSEIPTPSPTPTPPVTVTPTSVCIGDCNGDGPVSIDELVTGIGIALGTLPSSACAAFDCNADCHPGPVLSTPPIPSVTIACLIRAVDNALNGCPPVPCYSDLDCDDGNVCTADHCASGECLHPCVCD